MKSRITILSLALLAFLLMDSSSVQAQQFAYNFSGGFFNTNPNGGQIGHNQSGFGTFTGSEEWAALGRAPFPVPVTGDFPYGLRNQRRDAATLYQIDLRQNTDGLKFDSDIAFGDVFSSAASIEIFDKFGPSRLDISYFLQNQTVGPPTLVKYDIVNVVPATSKQVSIGGPSLFCLTPVSFSQPCFGRVGIERVNPSFTLDVNGLLRVQSTVIASDARLKKDIATIENGMAIVNNLRGTTYQYRADEEFGEAEFDFGEGTFAGFIAQEVEEILPHLVATDDQGYKAVNYDGVVPYLVEGMKELDAKNKELEAENAELTDRLAAIEAQLGLSPNGKGSSALGAMQPAELFQNTPNPFDRATEIRYFIPEGNNAPQLLVFDMNGRQLRSYDLKTGESKVVIDGSELEAGMYFYSLVSDGAEIDTKRMILTK